MIHQVKNSTKKRLRYHNKLFKVALKCNDTENVVYHHAAITILEGVKQDIDVILKR